MIKETFLPVRLGNSKLKQSLSYDVPQRSHPVGQGDPYPGKGDKEMDMLRHDYVSPNCNSVLLCFETKRLKCFMHFGVGQQATTLVAVERDEYSAGSLSKRRPRRGGRRGQRIFCLRGMTEFC